MTQNTIGADGIDYSKEEVWKDAPEGTTHVDLLDSSAYTKWMKVEGGHKDFYSACGDWDSYNIGLGKIHLFQKPNFTKQEDTQLQDERLQESRWYGDGDPEIGMKVYVNYCGCKCSGEIEYTSKDSKIYVVQLLTEDRSETFCRSDIAPFDKSPKQKFDEEVLELWKRKYLDNTFTPDLSQDQKEIRDICWEILKVVNDGK